MVNSLIRLIACFSLFLTVVPPAFAQEVGTIQGKVTDAETGELMRGATVAVEGTKKGAYSDVKGTFTVKNVPPGTYTLKISYVGYDTRTISGITVVTGKTTTQNVSLNPEAQTTEEVIVTGTRSNNNQDAMLQKQKNAAQVSNSISQEEIAKLPDANAGQALQRVSGVTLVDNKFIYVRGVSERYNNTTLNGAMMTSTEPDKKAFSFDMFPAEFLENATVTKSFTPDLPGNFAGGLVQLNTVDFPQGFGIKFSASSSYNSNVTLQNGKFTSYQGGGSDWKASDDGARVLPTSAPASRTEMNELLRNVRNSDNTAERDRWVSFGRSFNSDNWKSQQLTANPNSGFGLSFSNIFNVADNDLGMIASATYGNGYTFVNMERNAISLDKDHFNSIYTGTQSARSVNLGGLLNFAYKIGTHSSVSFKNVYNRSADDEAITFFGNDSANQRDIREYTSQYIQKEIISTQFAGEHTMPTGLLWSGLDGTLLDWRVGYSNSFRDQPDLRRIRYSRSLGDETGDFYADVQQTQQGDGTLAGRFFSNLNDRGYNGGLNISIPVGSAKIKAGGLFENKARVFKARSFTIIQSNAFVPNEEFTVDTRQTPDSLFMSENFRLDGLGMVEDSKLSDAYDAEEGVNAGFLMMDMPFQLGGLDFRFIGGARFESSVQRVFNTVSNGVPINVDLGNDDVLPSLNLVYRATPDFNVRMSASQTVTRPSLREFAPFDFSDPITKSRVVGNPNLMRALIQNYDVRFELFPNIGEVISASVFYKNFKHAIEETIVPGNGSTPVITFDNADGPAKTYGVELEFRKGFGFISEYFNNLIFNTNVAFINSEVTIMQGGVEDKRPMLGQSPYTVNIGLYFAEPTLGTGINIAYNTYGKRISRVAQRGDADSPSYNFDDPHVYELSRDVIDISISQPLFDVLEAKFVLRDLLNQPLLWEQGGGRVLSDLRGRNFSVSLGCKIQ
ncbi:MAG: TonB-dependent receptor [Bacteroidota bacterium]